MDATFGLMADDESISPTAARLAAHPGNRLIEPEEWPGIANQLGLTTREWEVVIFLFRGHACAAIASNLSIGSRTVRQYLEQIYQKIDVQDRVELVLRIIEVRDELRGQRKDA
jgi:DNA-binding NarL/FixJ family response regulator